MQTQAESTIAVRSDCHHLWRRMPRVEEELSTVVYIRSCVRCEQVEAKAGHKDPDEPEAWELIEVGMAMG